MELFNGIYSWDGKKRGGRDPISWFPGNYHLYIYAIGKDDGKVTSFKQHLCLYSETGKGHSISAHPEKFARHVCEDYSIDLERTLWVEINPSLEKKYEVIVYSRKSKLKELFFYRIQKRPPNETELELIEAHLKHLAI
ncbi:MAG: hypothetical protein KJO60_07915 [Desulfofustis sp.]|nr:hypothetical protein [Desulfofustis sp.]RZW25885.1 MAG: hypothetical protein EX260_02120 [Desulfobulbaceae bacterium]MBT8345898.1 hypothetical protein [Desulfofustis sp.]MBT8354432.1 hypothetical protein [Desulfofustis sp.]NNF45695.1 hypothetical protein [Desulfofustis sp.]